MLNKKQHVGPKGPAKKQVKAKTCPKGNGKKVDSPKSKKVTATPSSKVKVQNESEVLNSMDLGNETISLPVYSNYIDKDCEIDAFVVDVLSYCETEVIRPFFIGNYESKSFDTYIRNSSATNEHSAKTPNGDEVINLKRMGI